MNFKERGITIGDLLIILIIVISTIFIIDRAKESDKAYFNEDRIEFLAAD
tara:strand:+ start:284 stop:433 length:150 start_codon:yes stop_codon:yes gene_type:complete